MNRLTQQLARFLSTESAGGIVMLVATALALIAANSFLADAYHDFTHAHITLTLGQLTFAEPLAEWVQDVLMVAFFLIVGLELKREMKQGVLTDKRQVLLPLGAALGGMMVPAVIFLIINRGIPSNAVGWAIPTATDIAFALAVLLLAAKKAPPALKIFLLAIAIFDDLGAILIIAFFYSKGVGAVALLAVAMLSAVLLLLNHKRVMHLWPYLVTGVVLCIALYHAGIHTTIGGVITGFAIPMGDKRDSPLARLMNGLHPWVSFLVLPLFAFTAAGISFAGLKGEALFEPLTFGIIAGLFVGKQIGIFAGSWLLVKGDYVKLPKGVSWRQIHAVSILAGIGFTMSLFIGSLAFTNAQLHDAVKLGVLAGSAISAMIGWMVLKRALKN